MSIADTHCKNKQVQCQPFPRRGRWQPAGSHVLLPQGKSLSRTSFKVKSPVHMNKKKAGQDPFMLIFCIGLLRLL